MMANSSVGTRTAVWSTLQRRKHLWQHHVNSPGKEGKRNHLVQNLRRYLDARTDQGTSKLTSVQPSASDMPTVKILETGSTLGRLELSKAEMFSEESADPVFQLRGMDVFLTDDPEAEIATHPWMLSQGLRDTPTLTVNILTQWGNILIYFALPDWVASISTFANLTEDGSDPNNVKAVKVCFSFVGRDRFSLKLAVKTKPYLTQTVVPFNYRDF
jgi:hypothetical protein